MKSSILILLLMPGFCFAQQDTQKPTADDCPSWKKKKSNSKAEYFYFLRTNKAKDQLQVSGTNASQNVSTSHENSASEENPFLIPKKSRRTQQTVAARKNTTETLGTVTSLDNVIKEEEKKTQPEVITIPIAKEEKTTTIPVIDITEKKEKQNADVKEEAFAAGENDKVKKEKKVKRRFSRSSGKVKACKSGNASKCPSF